MSSDLREFLVPPPSTALVEGTSFRVFRDRKARETQTFPALTWEGAKDTPV